MNEDDNYDDNKYHDDGHDHAVKVCLSPKVKQYLPKSRGTINTRSIIMMMIMKMMMNVCPTRIYILLLQNYSIN